MNPDITKKIAIIFIFLIVILVCFGGVKRIGQVTEKMVPFMALIYVTCGIIIILMHLDKIPEAFRLIFVGAFDPQAVVGGSVGAVMKDAISKGVARGVYSNEAGMGSAGYGHASATTDHPARQGMWGCFEVIADTIIVCTMSALTVLVTETWRPGMTEEEIKSVASVAVERVYNAAFGNIGSIIVSLCLFLFVLSTIIVIVFYAEKQAEYLWGTKVGIAVRVVAALMVPAALFISFENAGFILDAALGLIVIPNMIGLIILSGEVQEIYEDFFHNPKYYPGAKKIEN